MSANTKIEWCHATVNHWAGCTAVSPACDNCYAKRMAGRLWGTEWGQGNPRHQFAGARETLRALDRKAKRLGQPLNVFHNSLSDFFDNEVSVQWRIEAMRAIADTPHLIHILLTKRIGNASRMIAEATAHVEFNNDSVAEWTSSNPWPNVWLGATICNQEEADRDIPTLLAVPAAKRFLSMEPLLGPVDLSALTTACDNDKADCCGGPCHIDALYGSINCPADEGPETLYRGIDWVIVGGESGSNARPMHPDWARSLRDQCQEAGVPFMFKQWGEFDLSYDRDRDDPDYRRCDVVARQPGRWINLAGGHGFSAGERVHYAHKVGKKAAGRLLDGHTWDGVPS